jgi:hypothetical protein
MDVFLHECFFLFFSLFLPFNRLSLTVLQSRGKTMRANHKVKKNQGRITIEVCSVRRNTKFPLWYDMQYFFQLYWKRRRS